ncbi:MAG: GDSL-type esterase/lipase family protein [Acidimicrobiia bacterium]|nr:GDSL-type esterase/lipase family protein [Acidimicrobiia bacterium]
MKWIAPILGLALVVAACGATSSDAETTTTTLDTTPASASTSTAAPQQVRILVLGDSYAAGEGVDSSEAWPAQLTAALVGENVTAEVELIAQTGWTSQRVAGELYRRQPSGPFDLVVIGVGSNDHFNQYGVDSLEVGVDQLVGTAEFLVDDPSDIVLLSIVDWRVTPRAQEQYVGTWRMGPLEPYNEALAAIAADGGHRFIDVTAVSLVQADDPTMTNDDGFHASPQLYRRWVDLMTPVVVDAVS